LSPTSISSNWGGSEMKSYRQFRREAMDAIENLVLEAKGFGEIAKKRRKKKKSKSYLSPREQKLKDLNNRPQSWRGLE